MFRKVSTPRSRLHAFHIDDVLHGNIHTLRLLPNQRDESPVVIVKVIDAVHCMSPESTFYEATAMV
jgi:hypothetical protein